MAVSVRQALIGDVERLAPLFDGYRQFYGKTSDLPLARQFLLERFQHSQSVLFVAEAEGEAVGFTQLYPSFSSVRAARIYILNDLFVAPAHRKAGAAAALLDAAAAFVKTMGAAGLNLSTAVDNVRAQRLYESVGWVRETNFYTYSLNLQR
ncbi:MAG TPA: GNAT family N-acetyltransferase [Allosphingosinicella sp.]|uniref:GNAT family N-acetyltransferase n=1 Tax=Allosphingosinicella sp. TaxID=2823234 RepID=UPI002ED8F593